MCVYAGRMDSGPGLCRLINTSSMNCWDGSQNRTNDIADFDDDDIIDQGNVTYTINILVHQGEGVKGKGQMVLLVNTCHLWYM